MRIDEMPAVIHDWPEHTSLTEADTRNCHSGPGRFPAPGTRGGGRPNPPSCPRTGRPASSTTHPLTTTTTRRSKR